MAQRNGTVGGFWRCDYGHDLYGIGQRVVGTIWGVDKAAVQKVAHDRSQLLALALGALHVISERDMNMMAGVWAGPAVNEWPRDSKLMQVLRSLKGDPLAVVPVESEIAKEIFDCLDS